jgi:hypothetical protein
VESQQVVHGQAESGSRREEINGVMKSVPNVMVEECCESGAKMVINGDVEALGAMAGVGVLGIARGTAARLGKAGEILNVEVDEIAWVRTLVAAHRRRRRGRFYLARPSIL